MGRFVLANPDAVPVVFVEGTGKQHINAELLPALRNYSLPFVLVIHNSDEPVFVLAEETALLDEPLLVACFAQNAVLLHPRLFPIP